MGGVVGRIAERTVGLPGTETDTEGTEGAAGICMAGEVPALKTAGVFDRVKADAATAPEIKSIQT